MNALKIFLVIFLAFICGCGLLTKTKTYRVRNIQGSILEISFGRKIQLIGIDIPESYQKEAADYIESLVKDKRVVLVADEILSDVKTKNLLRYVYVWGKTEKDEPVSTIELRGFIDAGIGLGVYKGLTVNLNAYLIKHGYAKVDLLKKFEQKEEFVKLEQHARENKLGMWASK